VIVKQAGTDIRFADVMPEARNLASIAHTPDGLEALLGFSNTARKAKIRYSFTSADVLQVVVTFEPAKLENVTETFLDQGEHYYGLWEHTDEATIDNRGIDQEMLGLRHVKDVNYPSARAPFFVTNRGWGLYVQSDARGRCKIAVNGKTTLSFDDEKLQYSILYGPSIAKVMERYNGLAGGSFMPPLWAFDSIWWRDDHHKDWEENGVTGSQALVLKDAESLAAHHIPASAIWLDRPFGTGTNGWGNMDFDETFPDPKAMIQQLQDKGMNLIIWIANRTCNRMLSEGVAAGYLFTPELYTEWPAADVRRPAAFDWFKKNLDAYAAAGVKGYKIDRGEEAEMPDAAQNRCLTLFAKLSKEGLEARHPGDTLVFARNVHDTGRLYTAVWNGDTETTWDGLATSVRHGQRCGAIDMPMWGSDVGGYHSGKLTKELFARWLQFGTYSTMMEVKIGGGRTPWIHYDEELLGIARTQAAAHHDLIPYTRSIVQVATRTGMPAMRSLVFDDTEDETLHQLWDEYMYGPSILVAPVLKDGARLRSVYLPRGRWIDYNDLKTVHEGGRRIEALAPLTQVPLFVKEGAIVPRGDILKSNNNWRADWTPQLRLEIFAAREGTSAFPYFTGSAQQAITSASKANKLTVSFGDLGQSGTLEIFMKPPRGPVAINGKTTRPGDGRVYNAEMQALVVPFKGPTKVEVTGFTSLF
jgi:alpha-glucosidase (family GH31 glycosyl hydrolase)